MAYKQIGDYGIIGDLATVALVGRDGAVDWLCLPYLDSPSVFAALLDERRGGRFAVTPQGPWDSVQNYLPQTNLLRTRFRTASGEAALTDFMPVTGARPDEHCRVVRRLEGLQGTLRFTIECSARPDYGREHPQWRESADGIVSLESDSGRFWLHCSRPLAWQHEQGELELAAGEVVWLVFAHGEAATAAPQSAVLEAALQGCCDYWRQWLESGRLGKYPTSGFWQQQLDRSALTLKLLQFAGTGAIAAAPTTSLPAILYGNRNWDYRFSWVRDASMTLFALAELGHIDEVAGFLGWIETIARSGEAGELGVLYRLREPLPPEGEVEHPQLEGYKGSAPVRTGQYVIVQRQHDVYGDILAALYGASHFIGKIDIDSWRLIPPLAEQVCAIWREPDHGIWEMRTAPAHHTHSKLMCWVALDRAIRIAEHYGFPAPLERWRGERAAIRTDVLAHGFNRERGAFVQHYGSSELDAAVLLIPLLDFLPIDDARVAATIAAIEQELLVDGVLQRYRLDDGLPGQESGFLICLFWYLDCLILQGRLDEVEEYLRRIDRYASPLGLFGEQFDPEYREIRGNYPQAYSHLGHVSTVHRYLAARRHKAPPGPCPMHTRLQLQFRPMTLNTAPQGWEAPAPPEQPAQRLKHDMNVLRGLFYDGQRQRVDYGAIREAEYYRRFCASAAALEHFDPGQLHSDAERIAFWINLYNAMVVHGVVELGIGGSVKEVPRFFSRIGYRIGGTFYCADDVEHGILRGNARPPYRLRRRFRGNDPRLGFIVRRPDPRIHFALVCASRTCPPIDVYTPEELERQLDTSAQVFINGGSRIDRERHELALSTIFRWYRPDFRLDDAGLVRWVARYFYLEEDRRWLEQHAAKMRLRYLPYDWRLNR
jgi:GH15 family glucan-1,4-alpha-glucosidase